MVEIHYQDWNEEIRFRTPLEEWIANTCSNENKSLTEVNLVFCSDQYLLKMNKEHLDHDYFTDIITFDYCVDNQIIGDLFISLERVADNAQTEEEDFNDELHRVIIHGILHLCGYGDKTAKEKEVMRQREDFYLSLRPN